MKQLGKILLRDINTNDPTDISLAFTAQGWNKPVDQYEKYYQWQAAGIRDIIIAEVAGEFAGYLTIMWQSDYPPFKKAAIPEIVDFNVLKKFQRRGIGTALMDEAEARIAKVASHVGIGFGLYGDYGPAQILYIKRGYIPDGQGMVKDHQQVPPGTQVRLDDDLVLYLTKQLTIE